MDSPDVWETLISETVADCSVFRVRRDRSRRVGDGKHGNFYVVDSPDWVNIIALTEKREVVMVEQFRHGIGDTILELPGGLIDAGEEPIAAARRELMEETGYTAPNWELIGQSHPNPAIQSNTIFHFLSVASRQTKEPSFDPNESLITRLIPLNDIKALLLDGQTRHSLVVAAFAYYWAAFPND